MKESTSENERASAPRGLWRGAVGGIVALALVAAAGCGRELADDELPLLQEPEPRRSGLEVADGVYSVPARHVERMEVEASRLVVPPPLAAEAEGLTAGDVLVTDWRDGFWRRVEAVETSGERRVIRTESVERLGSVVEEGRISVRSTGNDAGGEWSTRHQMQVSDGLGADVGLLNFSKNFGAGETTEVSNSTMTIGVPQGELVFESGVTYRVELEGGQIVDERFAVSGPVEFRDLRWRVEASGAGGLRRAIPLDGVGVEEAEVTAYYNGTSSYAIDAERLKRAIEVETSMTASLRQGCRACEPSELTLGYSGSRATFEALSGGRVPVEPFVEWLDDAFGGDWPEAKTARVPNGNGDEDLRLTLRAASNNRLTFRVLGNKFDIVPKLQLAYNVTASGAGALAFDFDGEGYTTGGYDCDGSSCRAVENRLSGTRAGAFQAEDSVVWQEASPRIDFQARLVGSAQVVDAAPLWRATPVELDYSNKAFVRAPYCPKETTVEMSGSGRRRGQRFQSYSQEILDTAGRVEGHEACRQGSRADHEGCNGDDECADGEYCHELAERCVTREPVGVTLGWRENIDLDLFVETPSGELIHPGDPERVEGELIFQSAGGAPLPGYGTCTPQGTSGPFDCATHGDAEACPEVCGWSSGRCRGGTYACGDLAEESCKSSGRCQWEDGSRRHRNPPFFEYVELRRATEGDEFRIWVVNQSGRPDDGNQLDEKVSYELFVRPEEGDRLEYRGKIPPEESSRSVVYAYTYRVGGSEDGDDGG